MNPVPFLAACLALSACDSKVPGATDPATPYRFDQPAGRFTLPEDLVEISALTVLDDDHLGAVQDEDGDLYVLSTETGGVTVVVPFGTSGDYEGIELATDRLFVLRSDGAVIEIEGWRGAVDGNGEARATVYQTGLGSNRCNAEGLGTDAGRLLIACKEEDGGGLSLVYAFDLTTNTLVPELVAVLGRDDVAGGSGALRPSALAVHPITGRTVMLASKREALVSLDATGGVASVWDLGPARFEQPEGLAFLANGDAFVSSEGVESPAVLLQFAYAPAR